MAGTTYSKFFWQDWQGDDELALCSMGAQGWWMRLLCIAGKADQRGRVVIGRKVPTPDDLKRVTKAKETVAEITLWNRELIENGVCDQDSDGAMVSRRLRRTARLRELGHRGGKATAVTVAANNARNEKGQFRRIQATVQAETQADTPATINHQPESINHQPPLPPLSVEENWGRIARLSEAIGYDLTRRTNGHMFVTQLVELEAEGFDFEEDMLPAVRDARAANKVPADLSSLKWFRQRFEAKRAQRNVAAIAAVPNANPSLSHDDWSKALTTFLVVGIWVRSEWGPAPTEQGCKAPDDMIAKARRAWEQAGNHPRSAFEGNHLVAWSPDLSDTFKEPTPFYGVAA